MSIFVNFKRISIGIGTLVGIYTYYDNVKPRVYAYVNNSFNGTSTKWNFNWDERNPDNFENINDENDKVKKPKAVRNIILIRHGQYNLSGISDKERYLTELGREQATMTGNRLKELGLPYTRLIHSTMTRAIETAKIIHQFLPNLPVYDCLLLEEGAPIAPEPPSGRWRPPNYFHQDGARIEEAFRKFFHRADLDQDTDSYEIIVCHANVIRYFVCRALQYPPEGWLRLSLKHASITWLTIAPNGKVILRCYGDAGYMPPYALTTS